MVDLRDIQHCWRFDDDEDFAMPKSDRFWMVNCESVIFGKKRPDRESEEFQTSPMII
jgi:hypothetical protein